MTADLYATATGLIERPAAGLRRVCRKAAGTTGFLVRQRHLADER
jgi:hypothetical protein